MARNRYFHPVLKTNWTNVFGAMTKTEGASKKGWTDMDGRHAQRDKNRLRLLILIAGILVCAESKGYPGTHGMAVSTWDTTRSTVVLSYRHGVLLGGGVANQAGYNANFTSTSGRLSSQFGLQFIHLHPEALPSPTFGLSASATAVYGFPFGKRHANGVPKVAVTFFLGSVPSIVVNGEYNYLTFPLNLGMGIGLTPSRHISFVPWIELAPSFNLDTVIHYDNFEQYLENLTEDDLQVVYGENGEVVDASLNEKQVVNDIIEQTVKLEMSVGLRIRAGLSMVLHLGDKVDLQINGTVAQIGRDFDAKPTIFVGGALAIAWDDPPPTVLPQTEQVKHLSCTALEAGFRQCAQYQEMQRNLEQECAQTPSASPPSTHTPHPKKTDVVPPPSPPPGPSTPKKPDSPPPLPVPATKLTPPPLDRPL